MFRTKPSFTDSLHIKSDQETIADQRSEFLTDTKVSIAVELKVRTVASFKVYIGLKLKSELPTVPSQLLH